MAPTDRLERRRLRERGAGITRDLKNASFAFTFGGNALPTQKSARKTPQPTSNELAAKKTPASAQARSTRKTPAQRGVTRRSSVASQSAKSQSRSGAVDHAPEASRSSTVKSGRRSKTPASATAGNHVTPSVTGKRKRRGTNFADDAGDQDELEQEDVMEAITGRRSWGEQIPAPRRKQSLGNVAEEIAGEDELDTPDVTHDITLKPRASLGIPAVVSTEENLRPGLAGGQEESVLAGLPSSLHTPMNRKMMPPPSSKAGPSSGVIMEQEEGEKENETHSTFIRRMYKPRQPLQAKEGRGSKRKAPHIAIDPPIENPEVSRSHRLSTGTSNDLSTVDANIDPSLDEVFATAASISDSAVLDATQGTPLFLTTPGENRPHHEPENSPVRGRKRRRTGSFLMEPDDLITTQPEEAQAAKKTKKRAAKSRKERQTRDGPQRDAAAIVEAEGEQTAATEPTMTTTVPITVYRLSKPPALDDDDELNDDSTNMSSTRLPAVNPVDVLTQITTEVIEHMAETAHRLPPTSSSGATTSSKANRKADSAELKRKRAILHHFKQVLSDSLFDVTTALDASNALSARLRTLAKQKIQLREELLSVKKQRDTIALKTDRVRREHADWREKTTNRDELSLDLWDLEMAVKSGREACARNRENGEQVSGPELGVDMLAAMMTEHLGPSGGHGGFCAKVEQFNHVLEKHAENLEGRAV